MALQNILPNIQADAGGAQLHLHPVPVPNGLAETGRMMTDAGQGLMKASFGLMVGLKRQNDEMVAKEDALALAEAKNAYTKDMTTHVTELMKRTGAEANGITEQFKTYNGNSFDRWSQTLSPNNQRLFKMWAEQQGLSYWQRVQGHEDKNVNGALITQGEQGMNDAIAMHGQMGDSRTMSNLIQSARELYATIYGASNDEEAIGKFVQGYVDKAHGARIANLASQGDAEGALVYYNSIGKNGVENMSDDARAKVKPTVDSIVQNKNMQDSAQNLWNECVLASGDKSIAGRYMTEGQTLKAAEIKQNLATSTDPKDKMILAKFEAIEKTTTDIQKANMALDKAERTASLSLDNTYDAINMNIVNLGVEIDSLPDSELRDQLILLQNNFLSKRDEMERQMMSEQRARTSAEKAEAREQAAAMKAKMEEWEKDPVRKALGGNVVMQSSRSDGIVTIGNDLYHINNEKERKALFLDYGYNGKKRGILSKTDMSLIDGIAVGDIRPEGYTDACYDVTQILKVLNPKFDWTIDKVSMIMPDLVNDYVRIRADWTNGGTNKGKPISDALNKWIINRLAETRDKNWWIMNEYAAHKYLQKAWNSDGTVDTKYLWDAWENYPGENVNKNIRLDSALNSAVSISYPDNTNRTRMERQKDSTFDAIYGTRGDNR